MLETILIHRQFFRGKPVPMDKPQTPSGDLLPEWLSQRELFGERVSGTGGSTDQRQEPQVALWKWNRFQGGGI